MKHDPLEPDRDTFRERDAAGLCIDCGENPQPERRGDDGTHHRCDECWSVYLRRQKLRERLSSEEWFCPGGVPPVFPERCDECGGAFDQRRFVLCCLYWDTRENRQKGKRRVKACLCSDCIEGCGYLERLNEAKSVLLIASLDVRERFPVKSGFVPAACRRFFPNGVTSAGALSTSGGSCSAACIGIRGRIGKRGKGGLRLACARIASRVADT